MFIILIGLTFLIFFSSCIASFLLPVIGLDTLFAKYYLSLDVAFIYAKGIISYILLFILATSLIKIALNSKNWHEFLGNLGILFLSLCTLAFFSMVFSVIFGDLIYPVLGVLFYFVDLDWGFFKMDIKQDSEIKRDPSGSPEPNIKREPSGSPDINSYPDIKGDPDIKPDPDKVSGKYKVICKDKRPPRGPNYKVSGDDGDGCDICTLQYKINLKREDLNIDKRSTVNILALLKKEHDLTENEGEILRRALNKINNSDNYSVKKSDAIDPDILAPTGKKAIKGDLLKRKS